LHFIPVVKQQNLYSMKKKSGFERFYKAGKPSNITNSMMDKAKQRFEKEEKEKEEKALKQQKKKQSDSWFLREEVKAAAQKKKNATQRKTGFKLSNGVDVKIEQMPLNKYLAHCGVTSRREAVNIIAEGKVKVNGKIATEPFLKISLKDKVFFKDQLLSPQKNLVYILLNKPKGFVTTTNDPQQRKTVLDLVKEATAERVYPVGRLDKNTTGVLLLTNDGDVTQQLTHPKYEIKKVYAVSTDKPVSAAHLAQLTDGIELEDGFIKPDAIAYSDPKLKTEIGIEIHSGRNRIVRRMFEHLGYDVIKLDRVLFAGLTKKNVERGKWRLLNEKEIRLLKHFTIKKNNAPAITVAKKATVKKDIKPKISATKKASLAKPLKKVIKKAAPKK
jgi:23S rRNA pseudouridine2605 synthase